MGIASFLCLLLPLIEITDDALMLMMLAVPPLICGLIIAVALHMLLYTLLLVLYGCRIQVLDLYFLQYIRRKTVGWRVQYLPAAERKVGILLAAVPWEKETGRQQERARTALFYVQTALAILFYALAVNLYGTASAIACLVLAWGYTFLGIIMPPSEIRKVFQPEKRRKMWQMQCLLAENLTDRLLTEMPEEYFTPPDKIQDQNDAALMINCSARLMMQNRYEEALDILTHTADGGLTSLRANPLKGTPEALCEKLLASGAKSAAPGLVPGSVLARFEGSPAESGLFRDGYFHVEGQASQLAALCVEAKPGETVLDLSLIHI